MNETKEEGKEANEAEEGQEEGLQTEQGSTSAAGAGGPDVSISAPVMLSIVAIIVAPFALQHRVWLSSYVLCFINERGHVSLFHILTRHAFHR